MLRPKVFVSYSHRDAEALKQLLRFLRPLEREGLLAAWEDTAFQGRDDWEQKIDEALAEATVGVLLISQDFLDSSFITQKEVPRLLERAATGALRIITVFLSPSLVKEIGFEDPQGGKPIRLTKFQGYGSPDQPLSDRGWSDKDRIYRDLARQIHALAGADLLPGAPKPAMPAVAVAGPPESDRAYEMTVQLEIRGETLLKTYHLPSREPLYSVAASWTEVQKRIAPLEEALDHADSLPTTTGLGAHDDWGDVLFEILFGTKDQWEKAFRSLLSRHTGPLPMPQLESVRLRIYTEDSRLSGLPWRLTSWSGWPLAARWTISTTRVIDPEKNQFTMAPASVLIVAPQTDESRVGYPEAEHVTAVLDVLRKVWPTNRDAGYVKVVHTRIELEDGLRNLHPTILYIYGRATHDSGQPSLLLEGVSGAERLALAELRRLFTTLGHMPAVVYLNIDGLTSRDAKTTPNHIFGDQVPLLLWRRRPNWATDSTTVAIKWLYRWLGEGIDPVAAFHLIQPATSQKFEDARTLALHANYRAWKTVRYEARPARIQPALLLDRTLQKALAMRHLDELVSSRTRRVIALIPFAAPGHSIFLLRKQLRHQLDMSHARRIEIAWLQLRLPADRPGFLRNIEEELKLQLAIDSTNDTVRTLLRHHAPKARQGRRSVIWLSWDGGDRPRLREESLAEWVQFSSSFLVENCPESLQIVSYLPQEVPAAEQEEFGSLLSKYQKTYRSTAFRMEDMDSLKTVTESDLLTFLEDPKNSSCDQSIQAKVAELIIKKTGGAFEDTVALLQEAEDGSWYDLMATLRHEQLSPSKLPLGIGQISGHTLQAATGDKKFAQRRERVFISYSHKDIAWLRRVQGMLTPLDTSGAISLWDDTKIKPGTLWKEEIESALATARVAILLVSNHFIASEFIAKNELPPLLRAAKTEGLVILWLCLGHCLHEETEIASYQAVHDISRPLSTLRKGQWEAVLADLARKVRAEIQSSAASR